MIKGAMRILSYPQAIKEAIDQEMSRDHSVILLGQGVDDPKGTLGTTKGLAEKFGRERVFDTPLSEDGMTGVAIGAALARLRPIHVHIRMDFLLLAMNQIVNMAAKMRYMFGATLSVPLVIRAIIGKSWGQGPQHSQSLYPLLMNIPGLKIVAPVTPYDAKGCMIQSIRDNNPVIFMEHRLLYYQKGYVAQKPYLVPLGKARILARGPDITLVGVSSMVIECLRAREYLRETGVRAEVIDLLSLSPLDADTVIKSALKTGNLLVIDNAWLPCAAGAEIIARLCEKNLSRKIKFARMGFAFVPCPTTPSLEKEFYPNAERIAIRAFQMLFPRKKPWEPKNKKNRPEEVLFKGPF
ncbi:MAG: transketolase C-terminal domain-containing protein [Candidatus Omnitrophica bacterium]|nr:transketolase C-terminal domain-containing protein [Candidatus Omnitrophota bacterium]MDD5652686.1 transketolase C-terminal domain-containing protein [Candidatus Omnitrophota bacterium]